MDRFKFFRSSSGINSYYITRIDTIIDNYDENKLDYNINDIIEYYNISEYMAEDKSNKPWTNEKIEIIKEICKKIKKNIACFCGNINEKNIENVFYEIDKEQYFYDSFFSIFEKYKIYERVGKDNFKQIVKSTYMLSIVLHNKKLVDIYDDTITDLIMGKPEHAELLLQKYEIPEKSSKINFPKSFSVEKKEQLIIEYINGDYPNSNYLGLIVNIQSNKDGIWISDKTKLLAKRKLRDIQSKIFEKNNGIKIETMVGFSYDKNVDDFKIEQNGLITKYTYSWNWIHDNTDFATLLNNFIYLFFFTDSNMRILLTNRACNMDIFERYIFMYSKNAYKKGHVFEVSNTAADMQIRGYYDILKEMNIRLENVIEWFFHDYVNEEFKVKDYRINMPSEDSTILEKCRSILSEMDYILKQYQQIVEDNTIDHELLEISSKHILFKDLKSRVKCKYIYGDSDEYKKIEHYLFSNQSMLHYNPVIKKNYNSFYELVQTERIKKEDFFPNAKEEIMELIEKNIIGENKDGFLEIKDYELVYVINEIYKYNYISYWSCTEKIRNKIDLMIKNGVLRSGSGLLSEQEIDYFNYYLNRAEFNNGLDLRNRYIHGTQRSDTKADKEHLNNYMIFLKLLVLLVIKINDEFCLYEITKNK